MYDVRNFVYSDMYINVSSDVLKDIPSEEQTESFKLWKKDGSLLWLNPDGRWCFRWIRKLDDFGS